MHPSTGRLSLWDVTGGGRQPPDLSFPSHGDGGLLPTQPGKKKKEERVREKESISTRKEVALLTWAWLDGGLEGGLDWMEVNGDVGELT